jgi:hypothetical protein
MRDAVRRRNPLAAQPSLLVVSSENSPHIFREMAMRLKLARNSGNKVLLP